VRGRCRHAPARAPADLDDFRLLVAPPGSEWPAAAGPGALDAATFALVEPLEPRLRSNAQPGPAWHVGFVLELHGRPGPDDRPAGEVQVAITRADEVLPARMALGADEYALAATAHLSNTPVYFRGVLHRAAGLHRVEQVGPFLLVQRPSLAHAS
jgi:hypothetical protein